MSERDLKDVIPREDRLAREERDQHRRQHQQERDDAEDGSLRPQHREPLRHGGKARPDHPRRVLTGDHEDSEDRDRELRHVHSGKRDVQRMPVRALVRAHRSPVRRGDRREEHREHDRQEHAGKKRPSRRAQGVQLRPLREDDAGLRDPAGVRQPRQPVDGRDGAHATASSCAGSSCAALNSRSSRVSSMNASSSETC